MINKLIKKITRLLEAPDPVKRTPTRKQGQRAIGCCGSGVQFKPNTEPKNRKPNFSVFFCKTRRSVCSVCKPNFYNTEKTEPKKPITPIAQA
jgi:hypothetical protein